MVSPSLICPCGSQHLYANCCGVYHRGSIAPSAHLLMSSRYSAYVLGQRDYLLKTWHISTRPKQLNFDPQLQWHGLEIRAEKTIDDRSAMVEFIAHYQIGQEKNQLHEISYFVLEKGKWYYVKGTFPKSSAQ